MPPYERNAPSRQFFSLSTWPPGMVWVRSEYAGELAVLSTWLSAFIPWNVMLSSVAGGSVLFVRFPFVQVRYAYGVPFAEGTVILDPLSAISFQAGNSIAVAYQAWAVGAGVFALEGRLQFVEPPQPGRVRDRARRLLAGRVVPWRVPSHTPQSATDPHETTSDGRQRGVVRGISRRRRRRPRRRGWSRRCRRARRLRSGLPPARSPGGTRGRRRSRRRCSRQRTRRTAPSSPS